MSYDPGTPTRARHIRDQLYSIDSFTGDNTTYLINLDPVACTCPHYQQRLSGTSGICKHIKQVLLQHTGESVLEKARQCKDSDLPVLLRRYEQQHRPDICGAVLLVMNERHQSAGEQERLKEVFR